MIFDSYFRTTEKLRWRLEDDIPWKSIDKKKAKKQQDIIKILRDATLIESFAPISHMRMLDIHWDDLDVSGVLSIQLFEEYKHFHVLKRYLDAIGEVITESQLLEARHKNKHAPEEQSDPVTQLAKYFMSEHFTGHFYLGLVERAKEPVLKKILKLIAGDEFRHSQLYFDLLKDKVKNDRENTVSRVLEFSLNFEHFGAEVVEEVPISTKNDFKAIVSFSRKIEQLTGKSPQEYIREKMEARAAAPSAGALNK